MREGARKGAHRGTAWALNATRGYADGATRALLVLYGGAPETQRAMADVFATLGARVEDPEACLPVDLPLSGDCRILSGGVELVAELLHFPCAWGPTSTWWTEVARVDGSVYVGLLGEEQRTALPSEVDSRLLSDGRRLYSGELPAMPFLRFRSVIT